MERNFDYVKLVSQAQRGDKQSLDRLAELARSRLCEFVYRNTLQSDLVEDVVQEAVT